MGKADLTKARILVVDDERANVRLLERMLADTGYQQVRSTTESRQVLGLYSEFRPDLILLDLMMPHLDGIAVIQQLEIPEDVFLPILVLTADATTEAKKRALEAGAKDFLTKPFDRLEVLLRIKNLLDTRILYLDIERQNRSLEKIVEERTQRLMQTEKLATMGSLLAGVAHELNNPLAVVLGQAHLMRAGATDPCRSAGLRRSTPEPNGAYASFEASCRWRGNGLPNGRRCNSTRSSATRSRCSPTSCARATSTSRWTWPPTCHQCGPTPTSCIR